MDFRADNPGPQPPPVDESPVTLPEGFLGPHQPAVPPAPPARLQVPFRELTFLATVLTVVGLDQWTKHLAREHLFADGIPRSISVVGELLRFTYVENRGAAFGLFQDQTLFFIVVGLIVVGVIIASYKHLARPSMLLNLALGLQMAGAIGNLIDRLRDGYVVDFIELPHWPVFNVADSAIVIGVAGLIFHMLFRQSKAGG